MFLIQQITADANQKQTLILSDGTEMDLTIGYKQQQQGWFITELVYQGFTLNGIRITTNPNTLYAFRNQIPFGLACFTRDNQEPMNIQDFSSEYAKLYILSADEVKTLSELYSGQISS